MEAIEFMRQRKRMCDYYGVATCVCDDSRGTCPALNIDCSFGTDKSERLIAIVEKWAKEHPEEPAAATTHKNDEPCVKTIQNELEGAIYREIVSHKTRIENLDHDVYKNKSEWVHLPCKINDTFYYIGQYARNGRLTNDYCICEGQVSSFEYGGVLTIYDLNGMDYSLGEIFLTKEEAERALAKLSNG